jgi:hypothetical protein
MATQRISFGEWTPDQPTIANQMVDVDNVVPVATGYAPLPNSTTISNAAGQNLTAAFAGKFGTVTELFAGGDTGLFKYDSSDLDLDDVSDSGGYNSSQRWAFAQFGNTVLATNNAEKLQAWTVNTSSVFANASSDAPVAKYITIVRDFVVVADVGGVSNKVQWSDINDHTNWTSGSTSQSDYQIVPDGGNILAVTGGEFGLIFLERAVVRMSYIGSPLFFQFDTISRGIGCIAEGSVGQHGSISYFLGEDGFYACDGSTVRGIGTEKIDRWFFGYADLSKLDTMSCAVDPIKNIVVWNFQSNDGDRHLLIYNFQLNRWSKGETSTEFVYPLATAGINLEGLNTVSSSIDALESSLDSREFVGGRFLLGGVDGEKISTFSGTNKTAKLQTTDIEVGFNSVVNLLRPIVQNGSSTFKIASRKELDDDVNFSSSVTTSSEGRAGVRSFGRYHRVEVTPTGNWTTAVGVDVDIVQRGLR